MVDYYSPCLIINQFKLDFCQWVFISNSQKHNEEKNIISYLITFMEAIVEKDIYVR